MNSPLLSNQFQLRNSNYRRSLIGYTRSRNVVNLIRDDREFLAQLRFRTSSNSDKASWVTWASRSIYSTRHVRPRIPDQIAKPSSCLHG